MGQKKVKLSWSLAKPWIRAPMATDCDNEDMLTRKCPEILIILTNNHSNTYTNTLRFFCPHLPKQRKDFFSESPPIETVRCLQIVSINISNNFNTVQKQKKITGAECSSMKLYQTFQGQNQNKFFYPGSQPSNLFGLDLQSLCFVLQVTDPELYTS